MKRNLILFSLLIFLVLLSACSSQQEPFQLVICGPYVDEDAAAAYGEAVIDPQGEWLSQQDLTLQVVALSMGDSQLDPMIYSTSIMKVSAMSSAENIDLFLCTLEEAALFGRNGAFRSLEELYTPQELAPYEDRLITFQLADEDGNLLEEETPPCGISLTGMEQLTQLYGDAPCGIFLASTSPHHQAAKEAMLVLAAGEAL